MFFGYFFAACAYILYAFSRFCRRKQMMLLFDLASKPFIAASAYFFNSLSGSYIFAMICIVLVVVNLKVKLRVRWLPVYLFFQMIYLVIFYYTYAGLPSILITTCVSITLFSMWWLPPQQMRLVGGINGFTSLAYHLSIHNWLGLLEIASIASNLAAYAKMRHDKKKIRRKRKSLT